MSDYTPSTEDMLLAWIDTRAADIEEVPLAAEEFKRWYTGQLIETIDTGYQEAMRRAAELVRQYMPSDTKTLLMAGVLDAIADGIVPGED